MGYLAFAAMLVYALVGVVLQAAPAELSSAEIQEILGKMAAMESEVAQARDNFMYRQSVKVQELTDEGKVGGEFDLISDIVFTPGGKRQEYVVQGPTNTLQNISLDVGDQEDLRNIQPFVLSGDEIRKYQIDYLGSETLEVPCYVFSVKPKKLEAGNRYFEGQIWLSEHDFQIVKSYGRGVGSARVGFDTRYPKFETHRKKVDGKYWFPAYTIADDTLDFQAGLQRIRMIVRYEKYKQFTSTVTITFQ